MTDNHLKEFLTKKIETGNCFTWEVRNVLAEYKRLGGEQKTAQKIVEALAVGFSNNEILQDRAYDILDIITGWCSPDMSIWKNTDESKDKQA